MAKLQARTEEQKETIFGIISKDNQTTYYSFEDGDRENIMIDGNISFDAMAQIVDYLRSQITNGHGKISRRKTL